MVLNYKLCNVDKTYHVFDVILGVQHYVGIGGRVRLRNAYVMVQGIQLSFVTDRLQ